MSTKDHRGAGAASAFPDLMAGLLPTEEPLAAYLRNVGPMMEEAGKLYANMFEIAAGTSPIAASGKDWRFRDPAWSDNPYFRRLSQSYLAMCEALEAMIPEDLPMEEKARAQLITTVVTSTLAPTNTLAGNPAALAKTFESGGGNLVRGFAAFMKDLRENGGLPQQVDASDFEVGRNLAVTPGKVVLKTEMFELIQYQPATETVFAVPALLLPPQIGRYYFSDLAPMRSFAEYVVLQGISYFAVSWRNPLEEHRGWGLPEYVDAAHEAAEAVATISGAGKVNLIGFCAGGILASIVAGYLAACGRDLVNSLTLCVTMLDFRIDASLGAFRLPAVLSVAKAQSDMKGMLPGSELQKVFAWLRPNDLIWNYWVNNYLMGETPPAFDILAWNKDSTNLPAQLHTDFLKLFEANSLAKGEYVVHGEAVDLNAIRCDHFVVGAVTDHLTPWKACYHAQRYLGGTGTFALSNGGHVAALVNPADSPKAYHWIGPATAPDGERWLEQAPKLAGSWWKGWTDWCGERSGDRVPAPRELGGPDHPPGVNAPGTYVRQ